MVFRYHKNWKRTSKSLKIVHLAVIIRYMLLHKMHTSPFFLLVCFCFWTQEIYIPTKQKKILTFKSVKSQGREVQFFLVFWWASVLLLLFFQQNSKRRPPNFALVVLRLGELSVRSYSPILLRSQKINLHCSVLTFKRKLPLFPYLSMFCLHCILCIALRYTYIHYIQIPKFLYRLNVVPKYIMISIRTTPTMMKKFFFLACLLFTRFVQNAVEMQRSKKFFEVLSRLYFFEKVKMFLMDLFIPFLA